MANSEIYARDADYGTTTAGKVGSIMQGSSGMVMLFTLKDTNGTAIDLSGYTVTGKIQQLSDGSVAAIAGATAVTANAADGEFGWTVDSADTGADGNFTIWFTFVKASNPTYVSFPAALAIVDDPTVDATFSASLVGVSVDQATWLGTAVTNIQAGTSGNFAGIDGSGSLVDSGSAAADFDAEGSAAAAQAAAIAASAQRASNLSDLADTDTARANLDIPIDPELEIRVIGDSIPAGAPVADLQAALKNVTVSTLAIGGETSAQILSRVEAVSVIRPARGATLSGATDLVVAENTPPRMVDGTYSASWENYSDNQMIQIDNVSIFNHHRKLGGATRRKFFARCVYGTSTTFMTFYTEYVGGWNLTPEYSFEEYAAGTLLTALPSYYAAGKLDGSNVSTAYAYQGDKSLELIVSAVGSFSAALKNGVQSLALANISIYELDFWAYVPVAFDNATETFGPRTAYYDEIIWLDGTSPVNLATDIGTWKHLRCLVKIAAGQIYLYIGSNTNGDTGKKIYIDNLKIIQRYETAGITPTDTDIVFVKEFDGASGEMPSGLSEYRRYYLRDSAPSGAAVALTSGGAAVDLVESGCVEVHENWHLSWTPTAPDTTTHYLKARAESADYGAFALIWSGHNDVAGLQEIISNIEATVAEWQRDHGDRFAVLTFVNRFSYGETAYQDMWEFVRQWIMTRYPNNYVDCYGAAIAWGLAQATSSQDYIDALSGRVPESLLSDGVHPNSSGYAIMFTAPVTAFMISRGYCVAA